MKKACSAHKSIAKVVVFALSSFALASCFEHDMKHNVFVPGVFEGVDELTGEATCEFAVFEINSEEYYYANGQNAVKDLLTSKYYALRLYVTNSNGIRVKYNLGPLFDYYDGGVKECPFTYTDGCVDITPYIWDRELSETISKDEPCYLIEIFESNSLEIKYLFTLQMKGE